MSVDLLYVDTLYNIRCVQNDGNYNYHIIDSAYMKVMSKLCCAMVQHGAHGHMIRHVVKLGPWYRQFLKEVEVQ